MYRSVGLSIAEPLWELLDQLDLVCYNGSSLEHHTAVYNKTSNDVVKDTLYVVKLVLNDLMKTTGISVEGCPLDFVNYIGVEVLRQFQMGLEYFVWLGVWSNDVVEVSAIIICETHTGDEPILYSRLITFYTSSKNILLQFNPLGRGGGGGVG